MTDWSRRRWTWLVAPPLLALVALWMGRPLGYAVAFAVMLSLVRLSKVRTTSSCASCGRTVRVRPERMSRPAYCHRCASAVSE
jgi:hypothetical protein